MAIIGPTLMALMALLIPIVALIINGMRKMREREIRHRERMRALELGIELPPDVAELDRPIPKGRSRVGLHGAIWLGIGAGLLGSRAILAAAPDVDSDLLDFVNFLSIWGLPALLVGATLSVYGFFTRDKDS